jgi:hypothetical protein
MEALLLISLLALLIITISGSNRLLSQLRYLTDEVVSLRQDLLHRPSAKVQVESPAAYVPKPRVKACNA